MITFLTTAGHDYTVRAFQEEVLRPYLPQTRAMSYDALFAASRLPPGTYVFTDLDRLSETQCRLAARFYQAFKALEGFRPLNDPARLLLRLPMLRRLHAAGLNDFTAYRADEEPRPARFPVFLRIANDHLGPHGDLIHDQAELDAALSRLSAEGLPLSHFIIVEYCAEQKEHGLFERVAYFRVADRVTPSLVLVASDWKVKQPDAEDELYTEDLEHRHAAFVRDEIGAEQIRAAFDLAGVDYGRADVAFVGGRPQVYEVNTNPTIRAGNIFRNDIHAASRLQYRERFGAMLHAIDLPEGPAVPVPALDPIDEGAGLLRRRALQQARDEAARWRALEAERDAARAELAALKSGRFWRASAPLRRMINALSGRKP